MHSATKEDSVIPLHSDAALYKKIAEERDIADDYRKQLIDVEDNRVLVIIVTAALTTVGILATVLLTAVIIWISQ